MIVFLVVVFVLALAMACTSPVIGGPTPFPSAPAGGLPFSGGGGSGMRLPGSLAPIQPGGGSGGCGCEGGGGGAGRCFPSAFAPLPAPGPSPCSGDGNSPR